MMKERKEIVRLWRDGDAVVLATLVHVEGSSYRRAGARLLMTADGRYAGAISGGCLEADLLKRARWLVRDGAVVERYATVFDDTAEIPYGLGCGGTVDVLLEPAAGVAFELLMGALAASLEGVPQHVLSWLPAAGEPLRRRVEVAELSSQGNKQNGLGSGNASGDAGYAAGIVAETLQPPPRVVVLGAGDDAQPLIEIAATLGWDTCVADGRRQWARSERFPLADRVRVAQAGEFGLLRDTDAAVIMTHSYDADREWLVAALRAHARYVGLLGSRHRSALLMSEAAAMLDWPVERVCERVYAPVGLDIGGDGAPGIALSIAAELQAFFEGKLGGAQRMSPADVAAQIERGGASRYLQTACAL